MGDCNARLDPNIDPTQTHVGPHVVGRRQTIPDTERDNALLFIDLLESHGLEAPQTFCSSFQAASSYKEMTCQDPLIEHTDVADWTTLDYALAPPNFRDAFTFEGSKFQQLVNSRHLPPHILLKDPLHPLPS